MIDFTRNYIFLVDSSSSMNDLHIPGLTRWNAVKEAISGFSAYLDDPDGFDIIFFGKDIEEHRNVKPENVQTLFSNRRPWGSTPMAEGFLQAFEYYDKESPTTIICFTDGQPDRREEVARSIATFTKCLKQDKDYSILFIQVGNDTSAKSFLDFLDNNLKDYNAKFDIVDTKSFKETSTMSPEDLIKSSIED